MHIGLIGGIGPAATEFYYHNLVKAFKAANKKLELTIVHDDVTEVVSNIASNSKDKQAKQFLEMTLRLQQAGADVVVVSSIAAHFCITELEALSPLPVVSIISALQLEFARRGLQKVGLLGHKVTMSSKLFGGISSTEIVVPLAENLNTVHEEYIHMATTAKADDRQREVIFAIGKSLCTEQGAQAVILAGTDLFLAFDGYDSGFTVIDSALVHIDALVGMVD